MGESEGLHVRRTAGAGTKAEHADVPGGLHLPQALHDVDDGEVFLRRGGGVLFRRLLGLRLRLGQAVSLFRFGGGFGLRRWFGFGLLLGGRFDLRF